jgi:uncharacterized RDD family membrane protein YckC
MASGNEPNPYQAPAFDHVSDATESNTGQHVLASRSTRLGAAILDTIVLMALLVPAQFIAGVYDNFPNIQPQSPVLTLLWGLGGLVLYLALNGSLLAKSGQTIGKRLLGIRIANHLDGQTTPFNKIVLWRILPVQVAAMIPVVGSFASLVDVLFIFRKDYRCIHDHLAGTIVVKVAR